MTDEQLLDVFRRRVDNARGGKTVEERKNELRQSLKPWMDAGLGYRGPKRPGLFLPDGTRNPARPARVTIPASPGAISTGTGTATAGPGKAPKGTKEPQPTSKGNKSSKGTGISSTIGKGNKSSTGTGTSSSTGTKAPPPPKAGKGPQPLPTGKDLLSGTGKVSSPGIRKGSTKSKQPSPLSRPPIRPEDAEEVVTDTPTGTDGAGWRRRDDLFEAQVMDGADVRFFAKSERISAVPKLASTIDYNTENWE
ncbi:hypothetical protein INS49_005218 [Diaporthe citri]|uniref:uncharacterized protein n=1 Tax=Diaporthe citri TaxID=83186 RepID=UPI001C80ED46|nr:uncharacterized protein INS49_005218 [Diaporthe citri]KAG6353960.1 hypothetical protein INS49_005218 [Diaporthe citri]